MSAETILQQIVDHIGDNPSFASIQHIENLAKRGLQYAKQSDRREVELCKDCPTPTECGDCEQCLKELFKKPNIHNIFDKPELQDKREIISGLIVNAMRNLDNEQRGQLIRSLQERTKPQEQRVDNLIKEINQLIDRINKGVVTTTNGTEHHLIKQLQRWQNTLTDNGLREAAEEFYKYAVDYPILPNIPEKDWNYWIKRFEPFMNSKKH